MGRVVRRAAATSVLVVAAFAGIVATVLDTGPADVPEPRRGQSVASAAAAAGRRPSSAKLTSRTLGNSPLALAASMPVAEPTGTRPAEHRPVSLLLAASGALALSVLVICGVLRPRRTPAGGRR
jgi:hypothetical protein